MRKPQDENTFAETVCVYGTKLREHRVRATSTIDLRSCRGSSQCSMSFVGVTFDPRRDQLGHLGALIELISELFVELRVAYLRHAFHLCANLREDGKNLLVHLRCDRSLDDVHERSGKWRHRYRRQPALRLRCQRAAQSLSFLLETRDCFCVLLVGFYQLKGRKVSS